MHLNLHFLNGERLDPHGVAAGLEKACDLHAAGLADEPARIRAVQPNLGRLLGRSRRHRAREIGALAGGAGCPQPALSKKQRPKLYAWADLLKRVFTVDAMECDRCCGRMRILRAVNPPEAIRKILDCLGMPIRAPPIALTLIERGNGTEDIPV